MNEEKGASRSKWLRIVAASCMSSPYHLSKSPSLGRPAAWEASSLKVDGRDTSFSFILSASGRYLETGVSRDVRRPLSLSWSIITHAKDLVILAHRNRVSCVGGVFVSRLVTPFEKKRVS